MHVLFYTLFKISFVHHFSIFQFSVQFFGIEHRMLAIYYPHVCCSVVALRRLVTVFTSYCVSSLYRLSFNILFFLLIGQYYW